MKDKDTRLITEAAELGRAEFHQLMKFKRMLEGFANRDVDLDSAKEILKKIQSPSDDRLPHVGSFVTNDDQRMYAKSR